MACIFVRLVCPVCNRFVANYSFDTSEIGKTYEYRCPNCRAYFKKRTPKKSNYVSEHVTFLKSIGKLPA